MYFRPTRRLICVGIGLLISALSGCTPLPTVSASGIPPVPPHQARIWVYRELQSSAIPERPDVLFNGAIAGIADMGGAFYRDVPPGHYHITTTGAGRDVNQNSDITLSAGETAYIKIVQLDNWDESDWEPTFATFYAWLIPPATARAEVAASQFHGGGELSTTP
jgi:hypothetical protein